MITNTNTAATSTSLCWMVDDLLRALGEFKMNMVYRNVDFNANKSKQYEAARDAMAIN